MAILQNFLGDEEKFKLYLDFARSIVGELSTGPLPEVVPAGLKETIVCIRLRDVFSYAQEGEQHSKLMQECAELRLENSTLPARVESCRKSELVRWMLKMDVHLGQSFRLDMRKKGLLGRHPPSSKRSTIFSDGDSKVRAGKGDVCESFTTLSVPLHDCPLSPSPSLGGALQGAEVGMEEPPPPGEMSRSFAANALREMDTMEHIGAITGIRDGVGELYVQSIMAYAMNLEGRWESLKCLRRCREVFVQHPGLCRYTHWTHVAHCILNALAYYGSLVEYSELQKIYNSVMDQPGRPKIPPFEEWSSIKDICDSVFCRSICSIKNSELSGCSKRESITAYALAEDDYAGGHSPSLSMFRPQQLNLLPPETTRKDSVRKSANEQQWGAPIHGVSTSKGKNSGFNVEGFTLVDEGVDVEENGLRVPGMGGGDWVELSQEGLGGGLESYGSGALVDGGNCRSDPGGNKERVLRPEQASDYFDICGNNVDDGRNYDVTPESGGCDASGFQTKQLMPLPLTIEEGGGLEGSDSASMICALDALQTLLD